MKQLAYSVRDSKAERFISPFFAPTRAVAQRMFETAANTVGENFNRHCNDYTLFEIGTFEDETGVIVPFENGKISLGLASEYIHPPEHPAVLALQEA